MQLMDVMSRAVSTVARVGAHAAQPQVRDVSRLVTDASSGAALISQAAGLVGRMALDTPALRKLTRQAGAIGLTADVLRQASAPLLQQAGELLSQSNGALTAAIGQAIKGSAVVQSHGGRLAQSVVAEAPPALGYLLELAPDDLQQPAFRFGLGQAAYDSLQRQTRFGVASQDRLTRRPATQGVGMGSDTITLKGAIFLARHGAGHLDRLRALGDALQPLTLTTGFGQMLGRWMLSSLSEEQDGLFTDGAPRRQQFTLELTRYGDDYQNV